MNRGGDHSEAPEQRGRWGGQIDPLPLTPALGEREGHRRRWSETTRAFWRVPQGAVGLLLVGVCWPLNWLLPGARSSYLFFPLWLGYILTVDALVLTRSGTSLLRASPAGFVRLFFVSAPAWWLFEVINRCTRNWEYVGTEQFSGIEYFVLCTISFSTVMPAVFETAELVRTFGWMDRFSAGPHLRPSQPLNAGLLAAGVLMLVLALCWPRFFYPFVWGSVFLVVEPLNVWLGRRHCFESLARGDWRPLVAISAGALVCGFFWEMWNYYASPKWIYHTPGVEFWRLFEMPLLGYLGYIFFAWELHALRNFLWPRGPALRL